MSREIPKFRSPSKRCIGTHFSFRNIIPSYFGLKSIVLHRVDRSLQTLTSDRTLKAPLSSSVGKKKINKKIYIYIISSPEPKAHR